MNDRYLYRAKRTDNGEWVEGFLFDDGMINPEHYFIGSIVIEPYKGTADDDWNITGHCFYDVDPSTICQCTGLKDKNGKLIWENDIVNCFEAECCGKISWNESEAGFYFDVLLEDGTYEEEHIYDYADCMMVIGNIFDNPELLEVE